MKWQHALCAALAPLGSSVGVSTGEIRKYYREQIAALVYGAMER